MADNVMRRSKAKTSPIKRTAGEVSGKAPRVKPVRITVDLEPAVHKKLRLFAVEADTDGSSVIRALLARLSDDPDLAQAIRDDVS